MDAGGDGPAALAHRRRRELLVLDGDPADDPAESLEPFEQIPALGVGRQVADVHVRAGLLDGLLRAPEPEPRRILRSALRHVRLVVVGSQYIVVVVTMEVVVSSLLFGGSLVMTGST